MNLSDNKKELATVFFAIIVLAITASYKDNTIFYTALISFTIILTINVAVKKILGHHFEINVKTKFWEFQKYGFKKHQKLKKPLPMAWLPLLLTILSNGMFLWLGILEFETSPKPERASRRHGLYSFTEITEKHVGAIAFFALLANILAGIIGYIAGFETFAKLSFAFAMWSVIPISRLDGTKIFFSNRILWTLVTIITGLLFLLSFGL